MHFDFVLEILFSSFLDIQTFYSKCIVKKNPRPLISVSVLMALILLRRLCA